ncbi:MAG: hypothetical protein KBF89_02815 [Acidimicrobiia bacterium]|nr:hypothetical protein [Acidimicrobiia bacterium]
MTLLDKLRRKPNSKPHGALLGNNPSEQELLNEINSENPDFLALNEYFRNGGVFTDQIILDLANVDNLRDGFGSYALLNDIIKIRFVIDPVDGLNQELKKLAKQLIPILVERGYSTSLLLFLDGGILPDDNQIITLIQKDKINLIVRYLEKTSKQLTPDQFEAAKQSTYSELYLSTNVKNGYRYTQTQLTSFVDLAVENKTRESSLIFALGKYQAEDFSAQALATCVNSNSACLVFLAVRIFEAGALCSDEMKVKLLTNANANKFSALTSVLKCDIVPHDQKPTFSDAEIEQLFVDLSDSSSAGSLLAQIAINQDRNRNAIISKLIACKKLHGVEDKITGNLIDPNTGDILVKQGRQSYRRLAYVALNEIAAFKPECLYPFKSDLLNQPSSNTGNLRVLSTAVEHGLIITGDEKKLIQNKLSNSLNILSVNVSEKRFDEAEFPVNYPYYLCQILENAVTQSNLTFDDAEVDLLLKNFAHGQVNLLKALCTRDHPFTEPQINIMKSNYLLRSFMSLHANLQTSAVTPVVGL